MKLWTFVPNGRKVILAICVTRMELRSSLKMQRFENYEPCCQIFQLSSRRVRVAGHTFVIVTVPQTFTVQKKQCRPLTLSCRTTYTGLFISPSGISELDCATTKTDTAERSISIGRESLQVFFFELGALAYFQVPLLGGSRDQKWRSQ